MSLSKKGRRIACAVMAAAVLASSALTVSSAFKSVKAVDTNNDDWLHAEGSRLYDKNGNEVWLTGANWFGFNCTENCAHGLYATDVDEFLSTVADHGINLIRLPISTELLVSWQEGKPLASKSVNAANDEYTKINPDFCESDGKTLKNSMEIFDVIMCKMKKYGLKVMIDVHSPASHNSGHNYNLWYYSSDASDGDTMAIGEYSKEPITWDMWKDSITWLADKYGNDDTIIGYDLKNEPHGKRGYSGTSCPKDIAKWDDSTDLNNWAYSATECANSVLKVNPNALIFIEGVEQYPKTEKGYTYEQDGSVWFKAEQFGADKDFVLVRSNGIPTYVVPDIAYHYNKLVTRNFDKAIDIFGADHHGYVPRLKAALTALDVDASKLDVVLMQMVRLVRDGEVVKLSKRSGKAITLVTLLDDIPIDAARFFFNLREANTHFEFDLDLAVQNSSQNPVYYAQYAIARICSMFRNLKEEGIELKKLSSSQLDCLDKPQEIALIRFIASLPTEVNAAAKAYDPSKITKYAVELASLFHKFYDGCSVKNAETPEIRDARMVLCEAVKQTMTNVLTMLKIPCPERM